MGILNKLRAWAKSIKRDVVALWLAARDPRVPWYAKTLGGVVAAYALSPIDLIPDFIPVIGYLDDLLIVPLGIAAVVRMIPPDVMGDLRSQAMLIIERPSSRTAAAFVVAVWVGLLAILTILAWSKI